MFFSRIASFFFLFFTLGLVAFAKPTEKRQESQITDPLNSIVAELQDVLGKVDAQTVVTVIPEITALVKDVNTKISILNGNTLKKRDLVSDVAILLDEIINDVVKLLDFTVIPVVDEVIIDLDVALNGLVITVNKLIPGVIVAVDTLLVGVGATLQALGLQLVFATLGL